MTTAVLVDYIDTHHERFEVEPICTVLPQGGDADRPDKTPGSYYAARTRPRSARSVADEKRLAVLQKVHEDDYGAYGVRKMHAELTGAVTGSPGAPCSGSCEPTGGAGSVS